MRIPGVVKIQTCLRVSGALMLFAVSTGCDNAFSTFYSGKTITNLRFDGALPAEPSVNPTVYQVQDLKIAATERLQDGWRIMGRSSWNGPAMWTSETKNASEQAKQIGASLVLWNWREAGSRTGSIPVTTPTTATTYTSGTVYGGGGSASYTGTSTSYGTQTSFQTMSVPTYDYEAIFFYRRSLPPTLGVYPARLTPTDQERAGTLSGAVIRIVMTDSPAAKGGLLPGDVIVRIGDSVITDETATLRTIDLYRGRLTDVEFYRRGELLKRSIQFGDSSDIVETLDSIWWLE